MKDLDRIRHGTELAETLSPDQAEIVDKAMERIRMGKTGYYHEIAELVIQRDEARSLAEFYRDRLVNASSLTKSFFLFNWETK